MKLKPTLLVLAVLAAFFLFVLSCQEESTGPGTTISSNIKAPFPSLIKGGASGEKLMTELGCNACHAGLSDSLIIQSRAPSLAYAGLRYNPSYLFAFLQNPDRIRHHIGHSRMPDFQLSAEESLALALYLSEQQKKNSAPYPRLASDRDILRRKADLERGASLMDQYTCYTCHVIGEKGNLQMTDLSLASRRLKPEWVQQYLVAPHLFTGNMLMPNLFYKTNTSYDRFDPIVETPEEDIKNITAYLFSINKSDRKAQEESYDTFLKKNKQITAELGKQIYRAQNCSGCHTGPQQASDMKLQAPDLSQEGQRVRKDWLISFLQQPHPIRPAGHQPGTGSRMPDFQLNEEEVTLIGNYLSQTGEALGDFSPKKLSIFSNNKAEALLLEKLPCIGCHQLNGKGGKIGPDLNQTPNRLQPAYVYNIIKKPHELATKTVMPRIPMPEKQLQLITNYLLQLSPEKKAAYASLAEQAPYFYEDLSSGKGLYLKYCAACHGQEGQGNGFNAANLPVPPTVHADANYISQRPDDTMYDGIYAGGYILDKSHTMPAFGYSLSDEEIRKLVDHIRTLCDCQGPDWSLDN